LIAASDDDNDDDDDDNDDDDDDDDSQEAYDALARDSVFDDNFERSFNEFSLHYLALSPWSADSSTNGEAVSMNGEEDFIQCPPSPVLQRGRIN
jgi:hypothetical protein